MVIFHVEHLAPPQLFQTRPCISVGLGWFGFVCVEEYVILFVAESPKSHVIVDSNVELLYLSESTVISPNDHKTVLPLHPIF